MKPVEIPPMMAGDGDYGFDDGFEVPLPEEVQECIRNGLHLTSCDDDGYCNHCGNQDFIGADGLCHWFLLCENQAVTTREHPILGPVPICERCDKKVEALS